MPVGNHVQAEELDEGDHDPHPHLDDEARADRAVLRQGMILFHASGLLRTLMTTIPAQKMTTVSNIVS